MQGEKDSTFWKAGRSNVGQCLLGEIKVDYCGRCDFPYDLSQKSIDASFVSRFLAVPPHILFRTNIQKLVKTGKLNGKHKTIRRGVAYGFDL